MFAYEKVDNSLHTKVIRFCCLQQHWAKFSQLIHAMHCAEDVSNSPVVIKISATSHQLKHAAAST
jgi:hypothetical protein